MTLYLLDANVLIRANGDYYPLDRIPPFWDWLIDQATAGVIKLPPEIYAEIDQSPDILGQWLRRREVRDALMLPEAARMETVQQVMALGYAPDLDDVEVEKLGKDPFLVAAALGGQDERVVVTREVPAPSKIRSNRRVPDICDTFGIKCITDFVLWRTLDFRIS